MFSHDFLYLHVIVGFFTIAMHHCTIRHSTSSVVGRAHTLKGSRERILLT
jgi:hypothetical protein